MPDTVAHPPTSARARAVGSSAIRDLLATAARPDVISLAGGLPDGATLPADDVLDALGRARGDVAALQYGPTEGDPVLREWIAREELGGVDPARTVVTHGAQQALRLVVDALVDPGDVVVVERASYVGMLQPLRSCRARIVDVDGDEDGMSVVDLARLLDRGLRPTALYLAPTFQNPTGSLLSGERRRRIGRLAAAHGFVVIDDDPYRRLDFGAQVPERLREHVPDALAVTVGSFSKIVAPGLRVGWVHGPSWLVDSVVRVKQAADLHTGTLVQRAVSELVARPGWLDQRSARLNDLYRERAEVLRRALIASLPVGARVGAARGGMFLWVDLSPLGVTDTDRLLRVAVDRGVAFVPGSAFDHAGRPSSAMRVCFASSAPHDLRRAAERLGAAVVAAHRGEPG